jgi:hypothetical protein
MAKAEKTRDDAVWVAKKQEKRQRFEQAAQFRDKTFEELKPKDKTELLKLLALQAGLIAESKE